MSMTTAQFVEFVFLRLGGGKPEEQAGIYRAAIEASLSGALEQLAYDTAEDSNAARRGLLQKVFSLSAGSGTGVVDFTSEPTIIIRHIPSTGYVTASSLSDRPLQWVPTRQQLDNPPPLSDYHFYTIFANTMIIRSSAGTAPSGTPAITIFSSYIPTISQVPTELEGALVDIGVAMNTSKLTETESLPEAPVATRPPVM